MPPAAMAAGWIPDQEHRTIFNQTIKRPTREMKGLVQGSKSNTKYRTY